MNKLHIMAKRGTTFGTNFDGDVNMPYAEAFIDGFKACVKHLNEEIELERKNLTKYNYLGERMFALKMYQDTMNEMLKKLEEE